MDQETLINSFDSAVDAAMVWLTDHGGAVFDLARVVLEGLFDALTSGLLALPFWVVAVATGLLATHNLRWKAGSASGLGVALCQAIGLWPETIETTCLVIISVLLAVVVGLPVGVLSGYSPHLTRVLDPVLNLIQTLPPWVYLIPAVMIFSLGKVPALLATVIYGIPPMLRITTLAFQQVPLGLVELGAASGATPFQTLTKIEIPSARNTLLLGLNQCILLLLAMVVLAGLVGAGGLGAEVTRGLTRMEMALVCAPALPS